MPPDKSKILNVALDVMKTITLDVFPDQKYNAIGLCGPLIKNVILYGP